MPELSDLLVPSLLDRLTNLKPQEPEESREARVFTPQQLRDSVIRDLEALLSTQNLGSAQDIRPYRYVDESLVNYGIPDLRGRVTSGTHDNLLAEDLREAILKFEPRIIPDTLEVVLLPHEDEQRRNPRVFLISGEVWGQPATTRLYMRTELDLETGNVSLKEADEHLPHGRDLS